MPIENPLPLLAVIAVAAYFQTVTGFGLGLIVMGATSALALAPVAIVATVVSVLTLVNSAIALPGRMHGFDRRAVAAAAFGIAPAIVAGVWLLDFLSGPAAKLLQLMLGVVILHAGIAFARRPRPLAARSSDVGFFASGFFSGLSAGLFGISGPPLIFQFYRQPMTQLAARNMLLLLFALTSGGRSLFLVVQGRFDAGIWVLAALTVPLVAVVTALARRFPLPLPAQVLRAIVFGVLVLIGGYLIGDAVPPVFAAWLAGPG